MTEQENKWHIGGKVRELRKAKGMTIAELAEKLEPKRNKNTVQSWEVGRTQPDADTMVQLCRLLDADIPDFYKGNFEYERLVLNSSSCAEIDSADEYADEGEKELLSYYRGMNDQGKAALLASAEGLYQAFSEKSSDVSKTA